MGSAQCSMRMDTGLPGEAIKREAEKVVVSAGDDSDDDDGVVCEVDSFDH